jgi:hypothetical protein
MGRYRLFANPRPFKARSVIDMICALGIVNVPATFPNNRSQATDTQINSLQEYVRNPTVSMFWQPISATSCGIAQASNDVQSFQTTWITCGIFSSSLTFPPTKIKLASSLSERRADAAGSRAGRYTLII